MYGEWDTANDADLMRRICDGDREAFDVLARRYYVALLQVARSRLGDTYAAEDAVQESLLAVYRFRNSYDDRRAFRSWLWTIHLNQIRRQGARGSKRIANESSESECDEELVRAKCESPGPADRAVARERSVQLEYWLRRLPEAQADALRLRFFGGLKYHEIAETMQCSLNGAKKRVRVGLLKLSSWMRASGEVALRVDAVENGALKCESAQGSNLPVRQGETHR